ncbi:hypothetical protein BH11PLA2_BH11PLA2_32660 [soil metagenome]
MSHHGTIGSRYGWILDQIGEWDERGGSVSFRCPFGTKHKNGDANPSGRAKIGGEGKLLLRCFGCGATINDFAAHLRMTIFEFFADGDRYKEGRNTMSQQPSVTVARYEYRDRDGKLLAVKHRLEPGYHQRRKDFVWRRPIDPALTQLRGLPEGWAQGLSEGRYSPAEHREGVQLYRVASPDENLPYVDLPQVTPGLYRLPELRAANPEAPVFVVEGEGKVDLLLKLGFMATCPPHGANAWDVGYAMHLHSRRAVVIPDDDKPGHSHAVNIVGTLVCAGAREIRFLERLSSMDGWPDGGDVKDWLLSMPAEQRATAIVEAAKAAPTYARQFPLSAAKAA